MSLEAQNTDNRTHILCVDLDGTLIRTNMLLETWIAAVRQSPWVALQSLYWLIKGKARLKAELAKRTRVAVDQLPYNEQLVQYLQGQKKAGRQLVLTTASHHGIAQGIAHHLGCFDEVIASDHASNLRGAAKAQRLIARFGKGGFAYIGNDATDLPIWNAAASALLVAAPQSLVRRISVPIEERFPASGSRLPHLLRAMRVYQWVKNLLVFVPLITANAFHADLALLYALVAFVCFSLLASGVYLLNDLADLEADRCHNRKRHRPFASGALPLGWGLLGGPGLIVIALTLSMALSPRLSSVLFGYAVLTSAYSAALKTQPLADVFTLALLYMLRIIAGGVATGYLPSIWLLSFSGFVFLSLAFLKRFVEVSAMAKSPQAMVTRRGYYSNEQIPLFVIGMAGSFASSIVLALYVDTNIAKAVYARPEVLWGIVPLSLFWQCHMWLAAFRGYVDDDPIVYAAQGWVSWVTAILVLILYLLAIKNPFGF